MSYGTMHEIDSTMPMLQAERDEMYLKKYKSNKKAKTQPEDRKRPASDSEEQLAPPAKQQTAADTPALLGQDLDVDMEGVQKTARLLLQPMLAVTLLQCKACSEESRNRFDPHPMHGKRTVYSIVLCEKCVNANKRIRCVNNFDILPYSKKAYNPRGT
jgi:hypothetical protein